jgi:hypothetical protein
VQAVLAVSLVVEQIAQAKLVCRRHSAVWSLGMVAVAVSLKAHHHLHFRILVVVLVVVRLRVTQQP